MIDEVVEKLINCAKVQNDEGGVLPSDIREVFDEIFSGLANAAQISSFLTALEFKDLSADDYAAALQAGNDTFKNTFFTGVSGENSIMTRVLYDNAMEELPADNHINNYIDISLAVDLILSSRGINAFKYSLLPPLKPEKSFEILNLMGVKIKDFIEDNMVETGFIYRYFSFDEPFVKYTDEIWRTVKFNNILNFIFKMLNPYGAKNIVLGSNNPKMHETLALLCMKMDFLNSVVITSDCVPFISIEGETTVSEVWKNKIFTYNINPTYFDIKEGKLEDLRCENSLHNKEILEEVFGLQSNKNKRKDAIYDTIILNSAIALYISKSASSLVEGINFAKKAIDDNLVKEKIEQIKEIYS